jgi:hypothetical protein
MTEYSSDGERNYIMLCGKRTSLFVFLAETGEEGLTGRGLADIIKLVN